MKSKIYLLAFVVCLVGCGGPTAPTIESDGAVNYYTTEIPVDSRLHVITGTVIGDINSLTRHIDAGYTSSGLYVPPSYDGKSFIRLHVENVEIFATELISVPGTVNIQYVELAHPEDIVILKVLDTKAIALQNGDRITLKCRAQYEGVGAVINREKPDLDAIAAWEYDLCRMASPVIGVFGGE